jgi:hypothetical protein
MHSTIDNTPRSCARTYVLSGGMALALAVAVVFVSGCDKVPRTPAPSSTAVPSQDTSGDGSDDAGTGAPEKESNSGGGETGVPGPAEAEVPGPIEIPAPTEQPAEAPTGEPEPEPPVPSDTEPDTGDAGTP